MKSKKRTKKMFANEQLSSKNVKPKIFADNRRLTTKKKQKPPCTHPVSVL